MRRAIILATTFLTLAVSNGCAHESDEKGLEGYWASIAGSSMSTLLDVRDSNPDGSILYVKDQSPLVNRDPSYTESQFGSPDWTILSACANGSEWQKSTKIELAIVPADSVTEEIRKKIADGEYVDLLACEGLSYSSKSR